jgi:type IV pilus assembly protein PilM
MMFKLIPSPTSIGLEHTSSGVKGANLVAGHKSPTLNKLWTFRPEIDNVKPLYIHHPFLTSGLEGKEILVRSMHLPLTKDKDIEAALAFQAEPLLPYAADQALLAYQVTSKTQDSTILTLLAARKEAVKAHLEFWQNFNIEPEKIACVPSALCQFGSTYFSSNKAYLILHLQFQGMTCVLIKEGKLWASFSQSEGLELLLNAQAQEGIASLPQSEGEWQTLMHQKNSPLAEAIKRLQKEIAKMSYALAKELRGEAIEGVVVTGEASEWDGLSRVLIQHLNLPLLLCEARNGYSTRELLSYAVPIGLALGSLPGHPSFIDFRQQEWSYPHPWRRLLKPLATYFAVMILLSLTFYFFGQQYLHYQEDRLRQTYLDLLSGMHKSHEQFELAFLAKNSKSREQFNEDTSKVEQLQQGDLMERLAFLQKELQATPDSFPLFANIPRVSDVFAWLSQHPAVAFLDEEGHPQTRLQIENFSYTMLKRPQQGKKQEKYQVKIELEFSSPTPKWAREFHDALIIPNDWVDPKGEVKWSSNRGKYKTSFFLKDKTVYPSS